MTSNLKVLSGVIIGVVLTGVTLNLADEFRQIGEGVVRVQCWSAGTKILDEPGVKNKFITMPNPEMVFPTHKGEGVGVVSVGMSGICITKTMIGK